MRWIATMVVCVGLVLPSSVVLPQALDTPAFGQADALLRAGNAEQAWALLSPLESQYAGQPDFDYLLAVAALESGRPGRATFILERIIVVNPGHVAARLEMARAYFVLRDFERAEREFDHVLKSDPPAEIRSVVADYLARMREPGAAQDSGFTAYADVAFGRDTNVSAAASLGSVFIPGLGAEFIPDGLFTRRPDDFVALGTGLDYAHALSRSLRTVAGVDLRQRSYSDVDAFDSRVADLYAALIQRLDERDSMQYTLRHNEYDLDNAAYRRTLSGAAQWSRGFGQRARVALSAQGYRIRYVQEDVRASSSDLLTASAGAAYLLEASTRTVGVGSIYLGSDNAVAGRADGDRTLYGFSVGLQRELVRRVEGYVSYAILASDYGQTNPDFGIDRRDRQRDVAAGLSWELADGWYLRPQVSHTYNRSNLPLAEYRRTETSLTLRRVWD